MSGSLMNRTQCINTNVYVKFAGENFIRAGKHQKYAAQNVAQNILKVIVPIGLGMYGQ